MRALGERFRQRGGAGAHDDVVEAHLEGAGTGHAVVDPDLSPDSSPGGCPARRRPGRLGKVTVRELRPLRAAGGSDVRARRSGAVERGSSSAHPRAGARPVTQCAPRSRASSTAVATPAVQGSPCPVRTVPAPVAASRSSEASAWPLSAVAAPATICGPVCPV